VADFVEQLRDLIGSVVREEVAKALAGARGVPASDPSYLSSAEAAALARVTQATVRRWIREERLKDHGAGREVRVAREELAGLMRPGKKRLASRSRGGALKGSCASPEVQAMRDLGFE